LTIVLRCVVGVTWSLRCAGPEQLADTAQVLADREHVDRLAVAIEREHQIVRWRSR
jgi:hypothetical protein